MERHTKQKYAHMVVVKNILVGWVGSWCSSCQQKWHCHVVFMSNNQTFNSAFSSTFFAAAALFSLLIGFGRRKSRT
jgi:hypothetical protein